MIAVVAAISVGAPRAVAQTTQPAAPPPDDVGAAAEGAGVTEEQAIKFALRAALEKGGRQEIFTDSKVRDYQLIHDTIISRAQGLVNDYTILRRENLAGGTVKVWIRARVSRSVLASTWGEVQNLLRQIGRPRIVVCIWERIDGRLEEQGILETSIEERLLKSGFDLVARRALEDIRRRESEHAAAEGNVKRLRAIAREADAHILVTGTANADRAGLEQVYGVPIAFYNCDAQVKVYYTDTGALLAAKGIPNTRGGARGRSEYSPQAAKTALANACEPLVNDLYEQIMTQWVTAISAGSEISLEVEGLRFREAGRLKKLIAAIEGVQEVNFDTGEGLTRYRIKALLGAQDLAELLSEGAFARMIDVDDVKLNRIRARALPPADADTRPAGAP